MIRHLWNVLRRRMDESATRQVRPNELRRDVVRAERLRRESRQSPPAASEQQRSLEEQRTRRAGTNTTPSRPKPAPWHVAALRSRTNLRQAILLKEILEPPLALRGSGLKRREDA